VLLLTNAPRPRASVAAQNRRLGVPAHVWDTIATSGDSARSAPFQGVGGRKVWHVGAAQDAPFFDPLSLLDAAGAIERGERGRAEGIV